MLCYHTDLKMDQNFNEDVLYEMFFNWLQTTRNVMEGLEFNHYLPFSYHINNKRLFIQEFIHNDILVISFITNDNEINTRFTVEIIYMKHTNQLELNFYMTTMNDSTYTCNVSIPNIFRTLINSSYTLKDQSLPINDQPLYRNYSEYQKLDVTRHNLPFVVLHLNNKGRTCISPFKLARELIGVSHVICVKGTDENRFSKIMILYPNNLIDVHTVDSNDTEKMIIHTLSDKLRNSHIQYSKDIHSLQKLQERELEIVNSFKHLQNSAI